MMISLLVLHHRVVVLAENLMSQALKILEHEIDVLGGDAVKVIKDGINGAKAVAESFVGHPPIHVRHNKMPKKHNSKSDATRKRGKAKRELQKVASMVAKGGKKTRGGGSSAIGRSLAVPTRILTRPPKLGSFSRGRGKRGGEVWYGTEFLGNLSSLSTNVTGDVLFSQILAPIQLTGTRVAISAGLFEFYKWDKCVIHYIPSQATTQAGEMILYYESDPDSIVRLAPSGVGSLANTRQAAAHLGAVPTQFFEPVNARYKRESRYPQFFNDPWCAEPRTSVEMVFLAIQSVAASNASTVMGSFYLEYECELWGQEFNPISSGVGAEYYTTALHTALSGNASWTNGGSLTMTGSAGVKVFQTLYQSGGNLPVTINPSANNAGTYSCISPPPGNYFLYAYISASSTITNISFAADNGATYTACQTAATVSGILSGGQSAVTYGILNVPNALAIGNTAGLPGFNFNNSGTALQYVNVVQLYVIGAPPGGITSFDAVDPLGAVRSVLFDKTSAFKMPFRPRILPDPIDVEVTEEEKLCRKLTHLLKA